LKRPALASSTMSSSIKPSTKEKKKSDDTEGHPDPDVTQLLGKLSLVGEGKGQKDKEWPAPPGRKFQKLLESTPFTIFECVSDLGYFAWVPKAAAAAVGSPGSASSIGRGLADVESAEEVLSQIDVERRPGDLVDVESLRLPRKFRSLPPQEYSNAYPFGQYDVACLHVASLRGLDLSKVDFAFGGSTLEMIATRDARSPYYAATVPGTAGKCILVAKRKGYVQNFADFGFQFERLVTGGNLDDHPEVEFTEHLHVMRIANRYRVLFRAEADAVDPRSDGGDEPVEVKASNPRYWGTKVMFQMISSGSPTLCHGSKRGGNTLVDVTLKDLSQVSHQALKGYGGGSASLSDLEDNIVQGMDSLKREMGRHEEGEVLKVSFSKGELVLYSSGTRQSSSAALLPSADIVRDLLAPGKKKEEQAVVKS